MGSILNQPTPYNNNLYLFITQEPTHTTASDKKISDKSEEESQRVKPPTPSKATDPLIGDEKRNGKHKIENRKKPRYSGPFSHPLQEADTEIDS